MEFFYNGKTKGITQLLTLGLRLPFVIPKGCRLVGIQAVTKEPGKGWLELVMGSKREVLNLDGLHSKYFKYQKKFKNETLVTVNAHGVLDNPLVTLLLDNEKVA